LINCGQPYAELQAWFCPCRAQEGYKPQNALDRAHWEVFCVSQTKLNNFCVIGCANWRATNVLWASEVNEECTKLRKRRSDSLLQIFWKN
jgi:hypothetical protein